MEINTLTPAERRVWDAFPTGEGVDFRTADDSLDLLLPVIDFGQERAFTPQGGWHQGLSNS